MLVTPIQLNRAKLAIRETMNENCAIPGFMNRVDMSSMKTGLILMCYATVCIVESMRRIAK
jgi:hypothetical protein